MSRRWPGSGGSDAALCAVDDLLALPDPPTAIFTSQNLPSVHQVVPVRLIARGSGEIEPVEPIERAS
jgi:hypothetical protein